MTPEQKNLVRTTWESVRPISDKAAELFYQRLFELDPGLKELFHIDMHEQGQRLMNALNSAVLSLDDIESIIPVLRASGRRHADYGVKNEDYETVGEAFLWTLEQGLQDAFTPEVKAAWTEVYGVVAGTMQDGAAQAA